MLAIYAEVKMISISDNCKVTSFMRSTFAWIVFEKMSKALNETSLWEKWRENIAHYLKTRTFCYFNEIFNEVKLLIVLIKFWSRNSKEIDGIFETRN